MTDRSLLALLGDEVAIFTEPLVSATRDSSSLAQFVWRARWALPDLARFDRAGIEATVGAIEQALAAVSGGALTADSLAQVVEALDTVRDVFIAVDGLATLAADLLGDVPSDVPPLFAADIADLLLLSWLQTRVPLLYDTLKLLTIIGPEVPSEVEAGGLVLRSAITRTALHLDRLAAVLTDPVAHLKTEYLPAGSLATRDDAMAMVEKVFRRLIDPLGRLDGAVLIGLEDALPHEASDPAFDATLRSGTLIVPLPPVDSIIAPEIHAAFEVVPPGVTSSAGSAGPGVELSMLGLIGWQADRGAWHVGVDVTGAPGRTFVTADGASTSGAGFELSVDLIRGVDETAALVIGGASGTRLVIGRLTVTGFVSLGEAAPDFGVCIAAESSRLEIVAGDGDGFLNTVLPPIAWAVDFDLSLSWSRRNGFELSGSPGLSVALPVSLSVAGIGVDEGTVALAAVDGGLSFTVGVTVTLDLGVFMVAIEGLGLGLDLVPAASPPGNLGPLDAHLGFLLPDRITFTIEGEAVAGGGFIYRDADRYIGGLSLDVLSIGVDAFTIIDTSLPGDPDGFALFATLTLRFPGIPLGFGFSLTGLGGILALNRGIDAEALALGLRDGAADAVLFPEDVLRDADLLIAQLDEYFPILGGNTVIGPVAEISWGVPTIITGQLGVAISLPQGLIVVLGSIEAILPDPDAPLLELHLDALGALDLSGGTLLVVASLYDSRLLGFIELSGDAAIYASWIENPYFLLSVGGFHPGFQPPSHVPSVLETLRAMRADVLIGLGVTASIEAYFAVTSNTVQFGGGFEIEASADFLLTTYTARGWFEFDVLIKFSPFAIMADASAGVGVYANDKELLGVSLSVHLEGPQPWYASGNATFKFFGINVKFDFAVGGHTAPVLPPTSDVLDLVRIELANPGVWSTEPAAGVIAGIRFAGEHGGAFVRPDHRLIARQTVAPFDRHLARFGELTPMQDEISVASTSVIDGLSGEALDNLDVSEEMDWFAPAMYEVMRDHARLAAPSYEQMCAGVGIGAPEVGLPSGDRVRVPEGHETEVWSPATNQYKSLGVVMATRELADTIAASAGGRTATAVRGATVEVECVLVGNQSYVSIHRVTGEAVSATLPFGEAVAASDLAGGRVVPAHAGSRR